MSAQPAAAPPAETPERLAFYERIGQKHLTPLWTSLAKLVTPEPVSGCQPASWLFPEIRAAMIEAGGLITAKEAERRVLILENPGLRGQSRITTDLYAGVQLVLPGEVAPAHRHSQSALRFVLDGDGAHTSVNGERTPMHYGDFIITPPMAWHDHGNETDQPMFWLDGLDIPIVQFLDASFAEHHDEEEQPIARVVGDAQARYGSNLLPVDERPAAGASPVFNYPYARTREALAQLARSQVWDPCHGLKMRYSNPVTGGYPMATIAAFIQLLPKGFQTAHYRSTDATIFVAVEGRGRSRIGTDFVVEWQPRDIFVVPSWKRVIHEADDEAVLFSFSDRPVQEALQLFREDRHDA
ncbi:MAG TPA: gentisate 1,2-dioxygenase [Vicinamibacterales bacterium]|jgi:gentisate 1,2-dioxygenase|nr:gentisate 1,2-dioxygenase [Vicinamibacterales bacterium]